MDLAFVIPAYNEQALIGKCVESVVAEAKRSGYDVEIVVVNNASSDRTKEIAEAIEGVRVVDELKKGLVYARKAGFDATNANLVANIDADTVVPEGWISTVMGEFEKNPKLVALSGPYIYYDMSWFNRAMVRGFYFFSYALYLLNRFVLNVGSMIQGGNFIIRRDAWEQAGGFDTSIAFYGEDTDVAVRMHKVGPVKWTFKLPMHTSGRRLEEEGVFETAGRYTLNYFSMTFAGKAVTKDYSDIRPD